MDEKLNEIYQMCGKRPTDWNELMDVVEFIESLDHKDKYYQWDEFEEDDLSKPKITHYNFNGYSVDIEGNQCWIWLNLELDPGTLLNKSIKSHNKFDAVFNACYEFAKYYNQNQTT